MSNIDWKQPHQPGPRNDIHDVEGILTGHAQSQSPHSGASLFVFPEGSIGAVDVRGGAPGSRETEALAPGHVTERLDGLFLSGGSAHGLAAGSMLTQYLLNQDIGIKLRPHVPPVPIVAGAVIYDLTPEHLGHDLKQIYEGLAQEACGKLGTNKAQHRDGAGAGARDALGKGGLANASYRLDDIHVGVLVVANPVGQVGAQGPVSLGSTKLRDLNLSTTNAGANTSIGVVATNLKLTRLQLKRVAMMAHDGLARAIRPVHTPHDGDLLFAVSTNQLGRDLPEALASMLVGNMAADAVESALLSLG